MADVLRFRNDDPIEEPAVTLDAFVDQEDASAVRIEAGEDPRRLIPVLDRVKLVELGVPRFRDGRCFTAARILREAGYEGEIRAEGDVLVDLIFFMRRCGIDSFRSEEHTSELQSLMRISYAVFCLKKKNTSDSCVTHYTILQK